MVLHMRKKYICLVFLLLFMIIALSSCDSKDLLENNEDINDSENEELEGSKDNNNKNDTSDTLNDTLNKDIYYKIKYDEFEVFDYNPLFKGLDKSGVYIIKSMYELANIEYVDEHEYTDEFFESKSLVFVSYGKSSSILTAFADLVCKDGELYSLLYYYAPEVCNSDVVYDIYKVEVYNSEINNLKTGDSNILKISFQESIPKNSFNGIIKAK